MNFLLTFTILGKSNSCACTLRHTESHNEISYIFCGKICLHDDALVRLVLRVVKLVMDSGLKFYELQLVPIVTVTAPASRATNEKTPPLNIPERSATVNQGLVTLVIVNLKIFSVKDENNVKLIGM